MTTYMHFNEKIPIKKINCIQILQHQNIIDIFQLIILFLIFQHLAWFRIQNINFKAKNKKYYVHFILFYHFF